MFVAAGIDLRMRWDSAGSLVQRCWRVFGVAGANFSRCEPEVGSHGRRQAARRARRRVLVMVPAVSRTRRQEVKKSRAIHIERVAHAKRNQLEWSPCG